MHNLHAHTADNRREARGQCQAIENILRDRVPGGLQNPCRLRLHFECARDLAREDLDLLSELVEAVCILSSSVQVYGDRLRKREGGVGTMATRRTFMLH